MALVDGSMLIQMPVPMIASYATAGPLDSSGDKLAQVFQVPKSGNIRNVWVRTLTVTTGDDLKISLQGIDANGLPDGTILGAGSAGYVVGTIGNADDNKWCGPFQLGVDVAVVQGQYIAYVVEFNSFVAGNMTLSWMTSHITQGYGTYGCTDLLGAGWIKYASFGYNLVCAVEYDDGTYPISTPHSAVASNLSVSSATNPDEVGNYLYLAFPLRARGIWIVGDLDYAVTLSLQNSAGTTLANAAFDPKNRHAAANNLQLVYFDNNPAEYVDLAASTAYRIVCTPGADAVSLRLLEVPEADAMAALHLGSGCKYTYRVDGGAWTEVSTKRVEMGLLVSHLSDGVGSGGGFPILGGSVIR